MGAWAPHSLISCFPVSTTFLGPGDYKEPSRCFCDWEDTGLTNGASPSYRETLGTKTASPLFTRHRDAMKKNLSPPQIYPQTRISVTSALAFKTLVFHIEGSASQLALTSIPAYCKRFSHPFSPSFQAENFKRGEHYEEARMGREEIGRLGFLPSSGNLESACFPLAQPTLPLSPSPLSSAARGRGRAAGWSRHLSRPGKAPVVTYPAG